MKVYTEIIYTWDDNKGKLVEQSSKSFEYEGEVILCHSKRWPHSHWSTGDIGGTAGDILDAGQGALDDAGDAAGDIADTVTDVVEPFIPNWEGWSGFSQDAAAAAGYLDPANVPDWLRDQWQAGEEAFYQGLDTTAANLEGFHEDLEEGWAENTETLNDMGDTFDYNVDQANAFVDNTVAVLGDTSSLINQGLGATIDINNPNALIVNPQGWYDDAFKPQGDAKIWYDWMMGNNDDLTEHGVENLGNLFNDYADTLGGVLGDMMDIWPSDGGASDNARNEIG